MKHSFSFPVHVREKVKKHINKSIDKTDPNRFNEEPTYITSLLTNIEGVIYDGPDFYIEITSTIINSLGRDSAEHRSGADFSITATISDEEKTIKKAILFQAKMDEKQLRSNKLLEQIKKMRKITKSPKVLVINPVDGKRKPYVCSGNKIYNNEKFKKEKLPEYFTKRVMTTFDGDTRDEFVKEIQNSNLPNLHILIRETMK